MHIKMRTLFPM